MENLLVNPSPKYYLDMGQTCYAAVDNAHGGNTYRGYVAGKRSVNGKSGYEFQYMSQDSAGEYLSENVAAENLFTNLKDVEEARRTDRSMQELAVRTTCSTPEKLIAFLLSCAGLPENERDIVLEQARSMGLVQQKEGENG